MSSIPPPPPLYNGNRMCDTSDRPSSLNGSHVNPPLQISKTTAALIEAIQSLNLETVKKLTSEKCNINADTIHGTPLSVAVRTNDIECIKLICSQPSININIRDFDGETPICLAIRKNLEDAALYLISKGCSLSLPDPVSGDTHVSLAVKSLNVNILDALLARGIDVNKTTIKGSYSTALVHAALLEEPKHSDIKLVMMRRLLAAGADVNVKIDTRFSGYLIHKLILEDCYEAIQLLLEYSDLHLSDLPNNPKKLDIDIRTWLDKNSALHYAVAMGEPRLVQLLLKHDANPNVENAFCDTPLSKAIKEVVKPNREIIRLLLDNGANPNFESTARNSRRKGACLPLFAAIDVGSRDYVDLLLEYGADLSILDINGHCTVMPCLDNGCSIGLLRYVIGLMEEKNVKFDISGWEYLRNAFQWRVHLQYLIDRGLNVNARMPDGSSIIHTNIIKHSPGSLEIALANGLQVDAPNPQDWSMLYMVSGLPEYFTVMELLVQYGADINVTVEGGDDGTKTPLHRALASELNDQDRADQSPVLYLLNCGVEWKEIDRMLTVYHQDLQPGPVHDRVEYLTSSDEEDDSLSSSGSSTDLKRKNLYDALKVAKSTPISLSLCCRNVIRSTVIAMQTTSEIKTTIESLPIPTHLKSYLKLTDIPCHKLQR